MSKNFLKEKFEDLFNNESSDESNESSNSWFNFLEGQISNNQPEISAIESGVFSSQGCLNTAGRLWQELDFKLENEWLSPDSLEVYNIFKNEVGEKYMKLEDFYCGVKGKVVNKAEEIKENVGSKIEMTVEKIKSKIQG